MLTSALRCLCALNIVRSSVAYANPCLSSNNTASRCTGHAGVASRCVVPE